MASEDLDELLDRIVALYADRVAQGRAGDVDDLLSQVPDEQRPALARCLEMVELGAAPLTVPKPLVPGSVLGGCRIVATIGRGGVATVHRAEQTALRRTVALKVLRPGLAVDPRQVARFRREGLAIARLEHPNVVKIHDVGQQDGHLYLVMELVDGKDLAKAIEQLPPAPARTGADLERALRSDGGAAAPAGSFERAVARLFAPIARAVAAAHAAGVIHRDLKPSNLLLRRDGTPVVADFGLAKGDAGLGDLATSLTGEPIGTPFYMSPEQIEQTRAKVDARTDVYSLGVTLYELLAGRRPFRGDTAIQLFDAIRREFPPPLRRFNPNLSRDVEAVVAHAMARLPEERYASAAELAADLDLLAEGRPTVAGRKFRPHSPMRVALERWHGGVPFEYKSERTLLGLPLVHVKFGRTIVGERTHRGTYLIGLGYLGGRAASHARGWIAVGDVATGVLAFGGFARGGLALGGMSLGVVSLGGLAAGGLAFGGVALGGLAVGGLAIGLTAIGGLAVGHYALGGKAIGTHGISAERIDVEAARHFDRWFRRPLGWITPHFLKVLDRALGR
jgi:tRNA A-37 threonylcarbamoyl transferase component Bud32